MDRAHARAGDLADRDVFALEHFEHADMRRAARAAAAEHEAGFRARRFSAQRRRGKTNQQREGDQDDSKHGDIPIEPAP